LIAEVIKGKLQTASREFTIYPGNAGESANTYNKKRKSRYTKKPGRTKRRKVKCERLREPREDYTSRVNRGSNA
jgi:hypothetical protein